MNCLACKTAIDRAEILICTGCKGPYHYGCDNITSAEFREKNHELKKNWKCPLCANVTRRRNDDTPVGSRFKNMVKDSNRSLTCDEDVSDILGDTASASTIMSGSKLSTIANEGADTINYDKFSELLKRELQNLKTSITAEITQNVTQNITTILTQKIYSATENIRKELHKNTNSLQIEQNTIIQNIKVINDKIKNLETENSKLRSELKSIADNVNNHSPQAEYNKKIVVYGLQENEYENGDVLIQRISNIFNDVMAIDINPYIENITRIGKRGFRRPLEIELISQRMMRYVLQNKNYFRNTGIAITKFMNPQELSQRKILRETLQEARQKGSAYIKGNRVYLGNKEYIKTNTNNSYSQPERRNTKNDTMDTTNNTITSQNLGDKTFRNL